MKIRPVGTKLFHADGQTDTTKTTVGFCNFANAPKNERPVAATKQVLNRIEQNTMPTCRGWMKKKKRRVTMCTALR